MNEANNVLLLCFARLVQRGGGVDEISFFYRLAPELMVKWHHCTTTACAGSPGLPATPPPGRKPCGKSRLCPVREDKHKHVL